MARDLNIVVQFFSKTLKRYIKVDRVNVKILQIKKSKGPFKNIQIISTKQTSLKKTDIMENAKNWITTLIGVLIAALVAAQPIIDTGHVDLKALILAVGIAVFGYFTQTKKT